MNTDQISADLLASSARFRAEAASVLEEFNADGTDLLTGGPGLFLAEVLIPYLRRLVLSGTSADEVEGRALLSVLEDLLERGHQGIVDSIDVDLVEELESDRELLGALRPWMGPRLSALVRD